MCCNNKACAGFSFANSSAGSPLGWGFYKGQTLSYFYNSTGEQGCVSLGGGTHGHIFYFLRLSFSFVPSDPPSFFFELPQVATLRGLGATGRWYAYGSSNGANEAQILAANAVVHFDALPFVGIAVHSGQMLAKPTQSAPGPYNYNQPCAGDQPCMGGRAVAQLSIHGTAHSVIRFHGLPFLTSRAWYSPLPYITLQRMVA